MRERLAIWHPGAALYDQAKPLLGNGPVEVRALFLPDERIVAAEEEELIEYRRRHGELPPFNSATPGAIGTKNHNGLLVRLLQPFSLRHQATSNRARCGCWADRSITSKAD